jgi:hypothetical protein
MPGDIAAQLARLRFGRQKERLKETGGLESGGGDSQAA